MSRTRSAILPMSIMLLRSLLHSINVMRRFLPLTTVMGPFASVRVCLVYRRTRLFNRVVLPTPGGPTMAITTGGGSSWGVRSTRGTWSRVWSSSALRRPCCSARRPDCGANAFVSGLARGKKKSCNATHLFIVAFLLFFPFSLLFLCLCTRLRWPVRLVLLAVHSGSAKIQDRN